MPLECYETVQHTNRYQDGISEFPEERFETIFAVCGPLLVLQYFCCRFGCNSNLDGNTCLSVRRTDATEDFFMSREDRKTERNPEIAKEDVYARADNGKSCRGTMLHSRALIFR